MELLSITLTGYKRFKTRTSLQTNGKLVALLGPNEAGKSSLLRGITHLGHSRAMDFDELSRDVDRAEVSVVGRFFLNDDEVAAAALPGPCKFSVAKSANGFRTFSLDPVPPARDTSHRQSTINILRSLVARMDVADRLTDHDTDLMGEILEISDNIESAGETLSSADLEKFIYAVANLEAALPEELRNNILRLIDALRASIQIEMEPAPLDKALKILKDRIPDFLFFDEDARNLASSYSIDQIKSSMPPALANLAEVADLDFDVLFSAIDEKLTHRITTIERKASQNLALKFSAAWKQSGIEVALRINTDYIEVQIVNAESEFTSLSERSDGLRQFVALQMFSTRKHVNNPVLLIDEADQRLHYDAQADLVQMLARQKLAPKVIYTTHSAGCLPEDLGNGVRMIVPSEDGSSVIVNRFWSGHQQGLNPLLIGLGASTMAFFPTRHAVMVEGPSDMLLYPTLFREALVKKSLGFQFVPGLSRVGEEQALADGSGILYLVDGDEGGSTIKDRLVQMGIAEIDIYSVRSEEGPAIEIEDFIKEEWLIAAANSLLAKWHPRVDQIANLDGDCETRMKNLENIFELRTLVRLPKIDLAYELLSFVEEDPRTQLLDPLYIGVIRSVAGSILARFEQR